MAIVVLRYVIEVNIIKAHTYHYLPTEVHMYVCDETFSRELVHNFQISD